MNSGFPIPGHSRHHDIRTAVHFMVTHHRKIEEVGIASDFYDFLYRGRFFVDHDWRNSSLLHFETRFGHLHAIHFLGQAQSDLGLALRDLAIHDQLEVAHFAVQVQRVFEDQNRKFFQSAQMLDDCRDIIMGGIDSFPNPDNFARNLSLAIFQKSPQTLRHSASSFVPILKH